MLLPAITPRSISLYLLHYLPHAPPVLTSEEITAQRRTERARFKEERERAIAEAAAQAEALFRTEGKLPEAPAEHISTTVRANMAAARKSAKAAPVVVESVEATPAAEPQPAEEKVEVEVEDMEHLQLTLQEAFFLSWALDCLSILDPSTSLYLSLPQLWTLSLQSSSSLPTPILLSRSLAISQQEREATWKRLDNPFIVNYAVYHHFRSLGWVVKSGIKFCVDYLLYKRGPVFAHAEYVSLSLSGKWVSILEANVKVFLSSWNARFSIVVCPVYEDPADEASSPFDLQNTKPFSWAWLSTLNRVNTQVRKVCSPCSPSLHLSDHRLRAHLCVCFCAVADDRVRNDPRLEPRPPLGTRFARCAC